MCLHSTLHNIDKNHIISKNVGDYGVGSKPALGAAATGLASRSNQSAVQLKLTQNNIECQLSLKNNI